MKRFLLVAFVAALLCSCGGDEPTYTDGKSLSVDGHTYFAVMNTPAPDTTFVAFGKGVFYLNNQEDGTYTQEKEVVKVEQKSGMFPHRVFISYGDFILGQGVYYQKLK